MIRLWRKLSPELRIAAVVAVPATIFFGFAIAGVEPESSERTVSTATALAPTATSTAPTTTTATVAAPPAETIADAQAEVDLDHYAAALAIGARISAEDLIRRRISNRLARRVVAAVRAGNRRRASGLLRRASLYPSTQPLVRARVAYRAAQVRAAELARARRQVAADKARILRELEQRRLDEEEASASEGSGCDPGYSGCVPPYPPDVDCADVDGPVTVQGSDPHGLDGDSDGVACE